MTVHRIVNFATVIFLVLSIWILGSLFEVMAKNTSPDPVYTDWNAFNIMVDRL